MDLVCYLLDDRPVDIRPSRRRRQWMDEAAHSYRCLPLSMANAHGWEVHCPATFEAQWTGGATTDAVHVTCDDAGYQPASSVSSHFGNGILTFELGFIIHTSPGYDLWVSGPVNEIKDGIQALSAVIETYWMPFTFTMNWKFTRPNVKVRFEKGEPFCFFFPVEHGVLGQVEPTVKNMRDEPGLEKQFKIGTGRRSFLDAARIFKGKDPTAEECKPLVGQGWYMRGENPDGTEGIDHQKCVELKPFQVTAET